MTPDHEGILIMRAIIVSCCIGVCFWLAVGAAIWAVLR